MSLPKFLQDKRFLQELDNLRIKELFVKITVLNWEEEPLELIQGSVISGNVNLDGNSSMRRTASLTIFALEKDNNLANIDSLFATNKKCKLEVGIVNKVPEVIFEEKKDRYSLSLFTRVNYQELYGDIVWFPLGVYVMFNPSLAHGTDGISISMNLKDKMCLLNGLLGGAIHSSVDFTAQDLSVDADSLSLEQNPVLVYNIIKLLVNHWGDEDLSKIIISEVPLRIKQVVKWTGSSNAYIVADLTNPQICDSILAAEEWKREYNLDADIIEREPGYDAGFIYTDFVYPGELVCNAGLTVSSVLDKIINVIGNYEYFYDVEGNFVFQEKQNYLNMSNTAYWAKEQDGKVLNLPSDAYNAELYRLSKPVYNFIHSNFTTAYNNTLNYNNIKNDFVVWGSRAASSGSDVRIPCRFHLAIDKKPELNLHSLYLYKDSFETIRGYGYDGKHEEGQLLFPDAELGARGLIIKVIKNRMSVDWREEIYYQMLEDSILGTGTNTELNNTYFQYYAELKEEFPKIFDLEKQKYVIDYEEHPDLITYFLDFIDENSLLGQYSVSNIGRRAEIIDDNNLGINCVFEPYIPDIAYVNAEEYSLEEYEKLIDYFREYGQYWTQIPSYIAQLLDEGGVLNSCFEKIKDLLYQYTHVNNTISITSLPIYYLEPNTRITVEDDPAGIYGDYIIQSISLPLDISSTMSINAYKALQKI